MSFRFLLVLLALMGSHAYSETYPDDLWLHAKPELEGVNPKKIKKYLNSLNRFSTTCSVIVKNGKIIGNYRGHKEGRIFSIGKTIQSMAIGVAIDEDLLSLESAGPVGTVREHLQQNYTGQWDYEPIKGQLNAQEILDDYTGDAEQYVKDRIFKRLKMKHTKPDPILGNSFQTSSCLDIARLGLLLARGGKWQDQQLVPESYWSEAIGPVSDNAAYGFLLWLNNDGEWSAGSELKKRSETKPIPGAPDDLIMANGVGGQIIFAIPSLDLVIVRIGWDHRTETMYRVWETWDAVEGIVESAKEGQ